MAKLSRNFLGGKMNKVLDERVIPNGEYVDASNVRMGSTEHSEIGAIENSKGNLPLTTLKYTDGTVLSNDARTIGTVTDSAKETIYWFVHDPSNSVYPTGKLDLIVSFNTLTNTLIYHIISVNDGTDVTTTLNFNPSYLITAVNLVDNLIFFSDNYNPPRVFNIKRNYAAPVADIDQFSAESILVIKKPPIESPTISPYLTGGQENFLLDRFVCFAYRYRYADNEYSAISQFSEPAFTPNPFGFSIDSFLNEGMVNYANTVDITYNTGSSLVVGIDLLFKESVSNTIKIIEKLDKSKLGLPDDTEKVYTFNNSKIFTVLPDYEILRLYDNVPRLAQAQTIMGNRLMYGNYIEGYDMVSLDEQPVKLTYEAALVTEEIGTTSLTDGVLTGDYNINNAQSIAGSIVTMNLGSLSFPLQKGGQLSLSFTLNHSAFSGDATPTEVTEDVQVTFSFFLINTYISVYALVASTEFQNAIGTSTNIVKAPLNPDSCSGKTLTDLVNCALPNNLDSYYKYSSGINGQNQPIAITTPTITTIALQMPAMRYVDDLTTPTVNVYEYYEVTFAEATFQEIASPTSLHSNRGYEVGIVYMDEFNRSTPALVSPNNTVFVPCGNSGDKNTIQITIPISQVAPSWATRYKFVIKADREYYETIYSSIFFSDPSSNATYFLLEGENGKKVEAGDRFIVKADSSGVLQNCAYATVLEKVVEPADFITIHSTLDPNVTVPVPQGTYMKINANSFNVVHDELSVISNGLISETQDSGGYCPQIEYPARILDTTTNLYIDYSIPAGSQIHLYFKFERAGSGNACENRHYTIDQILISSANYDSFMDWWNGDNVESILNSGVGNTTCEYNPLLGTYNATLTCNLTNHFQFQFDNTTLAIYLVINGVQACTGAHAKKKRQSTVAARIDVYRADTLMIFETQPVDALPDTFFENELSFAIDTTTGEHLGNVQNQSFALSQPAIIDTNFFNCYAFGNGAESYKIRDAANGKSFNFGNRVISIAAQDYKEINRLADITYSGVYNDESNINKFNEFNLGLINYKPLEDSFGSIRILDGRETDVLVLQEDKISYVLAGKNLLSDAAAGNAVTSVPEVLGTQIARVEKYGISFNPESYVHWGYFRYFTDVKRGAVLQLTGNSYSSDQLKVVSESGMRTWFRDEFIANFGTQKLGGYDPYMDEYVLTINEIPLPTPQECISCGTVQTFVLSAGDNISYCVNVGQLTGEVVVTYNVTQSSPPTDFEVIGTYNSVEITSGLTQASGSIFVNKNLITNETVDINLIATGSITLEVTVACPFSEVLHIVQICVTNDAESGEFIHNEYNYFNGAYTSPVQSNLVTFQSSNADNPIISEYILTAGHSGSGYVPPVGSTIRLASNKINFDTFDFDTDNDNFKYLRTNTVYSNIPSDIRALLAVANTVTPNLGSGTYNYIDFTLSGGGDYLYLIWDYRNSIPVELCYSSTSISDACCECTPCTETCNEYFVSDSSSGTTLSYKDCYTGDILTMDIEPYHGYFVCSDMSYTPVVETGAATVALINPCGCDTCYGQCVTFQIEVFSDASIGYTPCGGVPISDTFLTGIYQFCTDGTVPVGESGVISITYIQCGCP